MTALKNNIDHYMKLKNIKMYSHLLADIARELGMKGQEAYRFAEREKANFSKMLKGERPLKYEFIIPLEKIFGVSLARLMNEDAYKLPVEKENVAFDKGFRYYAFLDNPVLYEKEFDKLLNIDGKTIRPEIPVTTRKENFAKITAVVEGMDQTTYIKTVPTLNLKEYAYMDEFRNRDSRLYASMLFPFKGWHETDFGTFYYRWNPSWAGSDGNESWTGYSYRKLLSLTAYSDWASMEDYPVIRYAEVLLTYAEARIQTKGWDAEVQKALNDLRDRCGMPDVPTVMPSKEAALDFVRNERRIELAAEGQRYDDIRRYGSAYCNKVMNGTVYAPNGYEVVNMTWSDRLMLMPIPQGAMDLNPLLRDDQNPGY